MNKEDNITYQSRGKQRYGKPQKKELNRNIGNKKSFSSKTNKLIKNKP
jgi:hypothetical protein